ncbi:MAG: porphobilinogen synthase [Chloroflexi bacterium]|nr:porphobilinogen synthase [Chloroflexota bacterium]
MLDLAAVRGRTDIDRTRRLRRTESLRQLTREVRLSPEDLIFPIFVRHGIDEQVEIPSMPGTYQWSIDRLLPEVEAAASLGIQALMLFGIPQIKDPVGSENFDPQGIVQQAIDAIRQSNSSLTIITDVCLCEYTDHGHCGLVNAGHPLPHPNLPEGYLLNDETLEILARVAVSHAEAGADMVAPSGMIDGMVLAIREALDAADFGHVPILSYAVKYASAFYGPFRDAAESTPQFGDRRSHQLDPANAREALREARIDLEEGADLLMVKPALPYLDIIRRVRETYPEVPLAAFNVSGEYAMIKAAAAKGWLDEPRTVLELLTGIKRAGADVILSYHALEAARWLNGGS